MGAVNIGDMLGKALGGQKGKPRRMTVREAYAPLLAEESDKLVDSESLTQEAIREVENNGIVFLDEIDKICAKEGRSSADVSREGVQRDLLPLIEGTTVATKHGPVKTDHVLFIASGAFHVSKPSDLLPELQGRLPIRVELQPLTVEDFKQILTTTEASLLKQTVALMATEGVTLDFTDDAVDALARVAVEVNNSVENIGARRLQTVLERVIDDISFTATDRSGRPWRSTPPMFASVSKASPRTPISAGSSCSPRPGEDSGRDGREEASDLGFEFGRDVFHLGGAALDTFGHRGRAACGTRDGAEIASDLH